MEYRLINTRSPFFVQRYTVDTIVNCELKIWVGDRVSDKPTEYTYLLTKEATAGAATFELSELARDYIKHNTSLSSGSVWAEVRLYDITDSEDQVYLMNEGYTLHYEDLQTNLQTPTYNVLGLPADEDGSYRVMVAQGDSNNIPILANTMTGYENDFYIEPYNLAGASNGTTLIPVRDNSSNMITNFNATSIMSKVEVNYALGQDTVYVDLQRCSKYELTKLLYVNKHGMKTYFPFILKSSEAISAESDTFNRTLVNYTSLTTISGSHGSRKRIKDSKQIFTLNSDWMDEYYVKQMEELLLSEYVWLKRGSDSLIPVNITTSNLEKKVHINDKLINYEIKVETAINYINTAR